MASILQIESIADLALLHHPARHKILGRGLWGEALRGRQRLRLCASCGFHGTENHQLHGRAAASKADW